MCGVWCDVRDVLCILVSHVRARHGAAHATAGSEAGSRGVANAAGSGATGSRSAASGTSGLSMISSTARSCSSMPSTTEFKATVRSAAVRRGCLNRPRRPSGGPPEEEDRGREERASKEEVKDVLGEEELSGVRTWQENLEKQVDGGQVAHTQSLARTLHVIGEEGEKTLGSCIGL